VALWPRALSPDSPNVDAIVIVVVIGDGDANARVDVNAV